MNAIIYGVATTVLVFAAAFWAYIIVRWAWNAFWTYASRRISFMVDRALARPDHASIDAEYRALVLEAHNDNQ